MRVYAYGARPPIEGAHLVQQQLWLAHVYQRVLTLLERRRRELVERLYRLACPAEWAAYEAAQAACVEAAQAMRLTRARPGDMLEADEEMKAEARAATKAAAEALAAARARELETRQAWKAARKAATPKLRQRLKWIDNGVKRRQKFAYNAAGSVGLAWGTRLKVGEFVERAAEMSAKVGSLPKLPRFDGTGAIVVQLQGASGIGDKNGLAPRLAWLGGDTRVRLGEVAPEAEWQLDYVDVVRGHRSYVSKTGKPLPRPDPESKRSQRRAAGHYAIVRLRVGSEGRAPVWAAWPVSIHRPIPEDAPIKWAQMHCRRIGARLEWTLQLTVDEEAIAPRKEGPTLAVNLGWRTKPFDAGLRVAYAVGSEGHEEEVLVPPEYVAGVAHVDSLRSIRDRLFVEAKKILVEWNASEELPEWLAAECRWVDRWRAQRKLVRVLSLWRNRRFDGDQEMWETFDAWAKKDRHLWLWECDEREKLLRRRKDFYRCVAARWATRYTRILVTEMDLRVFAEGPAPEEGAASDGREQRVSQRLAAPSELRGAIENACSTRGSVFAEVSGAYKTQTCPACGVVFAFAAKTDLERTCLCGERSDQDRAHCLNLIASDEVMRRKRGSLAPSVTGKTEENSERTGRWQARRSKTAAQVPEKEKRSA